MSLQTHSLLLVVSEVGQTISERFADESPFPARLKLNDERLVGLHQRPPVVVSCNLGNHGLVGRRDGRLDTGTAII